MRIVIHKPTQYIEIFRDAKKLNVANDDVEEFYNILPTIIEKMGLDYIVVDTYEQYQRQPNDIVFKWHEFGKTKNTWCLKSSYLPNYFYFDRTGFSGWAELTTSYNHDINVETIRDWVNEKRIHFIKNNITRFRSPYNKPAPEGPYVLVLDQRSDDVVQKLAYIRHLPHYVKQAFADTEYEVVVRQSPLQINYSKDGWEFEINEDAGALHTLLASASAVYTVNSSAGFEALLHNKRVFTAGLCDYHWVTTTLKTHDDIKQSIDLIKEPVDEDAITKFLHYCLTEYFVNTLDTSTIERKILRAVNEYTNRTT